MSVKVTFHDGVLKRWSVGVRCVSHRYIPPNDDCVVFACSPEEADAAACDKMQDKWLRHQNKRTRWIVVRAAEEA